MSVAKITTERKAIYIPEKVGEMLELTRIENSMLNDDNLKRDIKSTAKV